MNTEDFYYKITETELEEIVSTISESNMLCNTCKLDEFCSESKSYDCKLAWKKFIEKYIKDERIHSKSLQHITDQIAYSMKECGDCQIKRFCSENAEYTTCNGSWYVWIIKKLLF